MRYGRMGAIMTKYYPPFAEADLVLRSGTCKVYYTDTSTPSGISYELYGMSYDGTCPDCGGVTVEMEGGDPLVVEDCRDYDLCLMCLRRITMEYLEAKIIASG